MRVLSSATCQQNSKSTDKSIKYSGFVVRGFSKTLSHESFTIQLIIQY